MRHNIKMKRMFHHTAATRQYGKTFLVRVGAEQ